MKNSFLKSVELLTIYSSDNYLKYGLFGYIPWLTSAFFIIVMRASRIFTWYEYDVAMGDYIGGFISISVFMLIMIMGPAMKGIYGKEKYKEISEISTMLPIGNKDKQLLKSLTFYLSTVAPLVGILAIYSGGANTSQSIKLTGVLIMIMFVFMLTLSILNYSSIHSGEKQFKRNKTIFLTTWSVGYIIIIIESYFNENSVFNRFLKYVMDIKGISFLGEVRSGLIVVGVVFLVFIMVNNRIIKAGISEGA